MRVRELPNKDPQDSIGCAECYRRPHPIMDITTETGEGIILCKLCMRKLGKLMLNWKREET